MSINNHEPRIYEDELIDDFRREMAVKRKHDKADKAPKSTETVKIKFSLKDLYPVKAQTENQKRFFTSYKQNQERNFFLHGSAGTGKTFISMALGLRDVLDPSTPYEKLMVVRSAVQSGVELGFMPGSLEEKVAQFEQPYNEICSELFVKGFNYQNAKDAGVIKFAPTSFLRGTTIRDTVIVVDEVQNMNFGELDTIITRIGSNSRIIFCGDIKQNDLLNKRNNHSGFYPFINIMEMMEDRFETIEFTHDDIVRSGLVKDYIISKEKWFENEESLSDNQK